MCSTLQARFARPPFAAMAADIRIYVPFALSRPDDGAIFLKS